MQSNASSNPKVLKKNTSKFGGGDSDDDNQASDNDSDNDVKPTQNAFNNIKPQN